MRTETNPFRLLRRFVILDEPDENYERDTLAYGCVMPSGTHYTEWNRRAFPEDEQTDNPVVSRYESREDAVQASGGTVVYIDPRASKAVPTGDEPAVTIGYDPTAEMAGFDFLENREEEGE